MDPGSPNSSFVDIVKSLLARIKAQCAAEEKFMNEEIIKLPEPRWPAD
jgi:hypothetical protein